MYMYSSKNLNAPQLNNQWGDFNKVINYILDGGTEVPVSKIEYIEPKKIKISMDNSNFEQHETVEILGSTIVGYNLRYFIESVNKVDNTAILYNSLLSSDLGVDNNPNIKAKIIKCGMTKKFGGVSDNRTVFKSANGMEYRIDDRNFADLLNPPIVFNVGWQKICRVSMSSNYDSLDSANERVIPYNSARPNENYTPDGNYIGERFIIYNQISTSTNSVYDGITAINAVLPRGKTDYVIFANSQVLYIIILNPTNYNLNHQYVIGEYKSNKNIKSAVLLTHRSLYPYTYTADNSNCNNINKFIVSTYTTHQSSSILCKSGGYNGNSNNIEIYDNNTGQSEYILTNPNSQINFQDANYKISSGLHNLNFSDNITYFSDTLLIKSTNITNPQNLSEYITDIYGALIDIKWINGDINSSILDTIILNDGGVYKTIKNINGYAPSNYYTSSNYLIRLDTQ